MLNTNPTGWDSAPRLTREENKWQRQTWTHQEAEPGSLDSHPDLQWCLVCVCFFLAAGVPKTTYSKSVYVVFFFFPVATESRKAQCRAKVGRLCSCELAVN